MDPDRFLHICCRAVASAVSTALAPLYNAILIHSCGFGLAGAAFANDAIFLTTTLLLGGWTIWYDTAVEGRPEDTWQGWCVPCDHAPMGQLWTLDTFNARSLRWDRKGTK